MSVEIKRRRLMLSGVKLACGGTMALVCMGAILEAPGTSWSSDGLVRMVMLSVLVAISLSLVVSNA
jgi:uncharacterized membrane protein